MTYNPKERRKGDGRKNRTILGVTLEEIEQRKLEVRNSWDVRTERNRRVGVYKRVSYRVHSVDDSMITSSHSIYD